MRKLRLRGLSKVFVTQSLKKAGKSSPKKRKGGQTHAAPPRTPEELRILVC